MLLEPGPAMSDEIDKLRHVGVDLDLDIFSD